MNGKEAKWNTEKGGRPDRPLFVPNRQLRLREQVREVMRFFHYSFRTEETYWHWIERYLRFQRGRDDGLGSAGASPYRWRRPETMGAPEVAEFLSER